VPPDYNASSAVFRDGIWARDRESDYDAATLRHSFSLYSDTYGFLWDIVRLSFRGMDHLRVHPRFLHSNATSHKWALGAFAELLDNSLDEVRTGATYVKVDDIQIRGARDPKKIEMAKDYPNSRHFLTYRHSFRKITYKPAQPAADGVTKNDKNQMSADVTIGFVKDAKDHIDVQGFNVYHKNRLIKPFWRVWNAAGSNGRGVIACASTSRKSPFQASSSSKVLKASTNSLHSKVINRAQPLNAFGYASVDPKVGTVQELRKENHELKQRGGGTDSEMINSLLTDLLCERDKNALLKKLLQKAKEKIQEAEQKTKSWTKNMKPSLKYFLMKEADNVKWNQI
nr:protein microrchidia 7-like [Tanacetum cinerariifolium]